MAVRKGAPRGPKAESRHGKIASGNRRRQLLASEEQFAAWDVAAARIGVSFNEWARRVLDVAAHRRDPRSSHRG